MTRTKLCDRSLPCYSLGEEVMNSVTHGLGAAFGILALVLCVIRAGSTQDPFRIVSACIYGASAICLYGVSCVYHGLMPSTPKKVLQVIDHCTIYFLIAGTYTPFALAATRPMHPVLGWGLFAFQWGVSALAVTLTAIDLKKYNTFSMICYIGLGWAILPMAKLLTEAITLKGFYWLLFGGIAYTIGAVLYGLGVKHKWMHSIFHCFVVLGSVLQFIAVYGYVLG